MILPLCSDVVAWLVSVPLAFVSHSWTYGGECIQHDIWMDVFLHPSVHYRSIRKNICIKIVFGGPVRLKFPSSTIFLAKVGQHRNRCFFDVAA